MPSQCGLAFFILPTYALQQPNIASCGVTTTYWTKMPAPPRRAAQVQLNPNLNFYHIPVIDVYPCFVNISSSSKSNCGYLAFKIRSAFITIVTALIATVLSQVTIPSCAVSYCTTSVIALDTACIKWNLGWLPCQLSQSRLHDASMFLRRRCPAARLARTVILLHCPILLGSGPAE